MDREEYQKCCESPGYFFNNYVMVKDADGNWVKPNPVTDEQIAEAAKEARREYQRRRDTIRTCMSKTIMKLFPDVFKGKVVLQAKVKEEIINELKPLSKAQKDHDHLQRMTREEAQAIIENHCPCWPGCSKPCDDCSRLSMLIVYGFADFYGVVVDENGNALEDKED